LQDFRTTDLKKVGGFIFIPGGPGAGLLQPPFDLRFTVRGDRANCLQNFFLGRCKSTARSTCPLIFKRIDQRWRIRRADAV